MTMVELTHAPRTFVHSHQLKGAFPILERACNGAKISADLMGSRLCCLQTVLVAVAVAIPVTVAVAGLLMRGHRT
jgi:hypothetical protein